MAFKDRLKQAMAEGGFTQASLAKETNMAQSMIWKLVSGKSSGTSRIVELSKVLGVRPEWLSEGSGPMRGNETPLQTIPAIYKSLSPVDIYNGDLSTGEALMVPNLIRNSSCKAYLLSEDTGCSEAPKGTYIVVDSEEPAGNNDLVYAEINNKRSVYRFIRGGESDFLSVDDPRVPLIPVKTATLLGVVVFLLRAFRRN